MALEIASTAILKCGHWGFYNNMCGIFGCVLGVDSSVTFNEFYALCVNLFVLSESRGKESCGFYLHCQEDEKLFKFSFPASRVVTTSEFKTTVVDFFGKYVASERKNNLVLLGHSRLMTDGDNSFENNQPVAKYDSCCVHNGIIVNSDELFEQYALHRDVFVDTEIVPELYNNFKREGKSTSECIRLIYGQIKGSASIGLYDKAFGNVVLATNTGSLYSCFDKSKQLFFFASERYICQKIISNFRLKPIFRAANIDQVKPFTACVVLARELSTLSCRLGRPVYDGINSPGSASNLQKRSRQLGPGVDKGFDSSPPRLKRCSKCILPETVPFIDFDENGVCNFCRNYKKCEVVGPDTLKRLVREQIAGKGSSPDCLVAFSGGRDSSYMLHYVKQELGLNPIAYTYDWGMVTDLARRNQARLCGKLGVEHIIVSADIKKKREYIRKNINAWLKRPELGMVPLFMAGDKQFFYYNRKLMRQTGTRHVFWGTNPLELCVFKTGFAGAEPSIWKDYYEENVSQKSSALKEKIKLTSYYGYQYLRNPSYINSSFLDTFFAYFCSMVFPVTKEMVMFYRYVPIDEHKIMKTLIEEYEWERETDTNTTWRIGDGTTAFYNYIYYRIAGVTENDTFRSNQIREGLIDRDKALKLVEQENKVRPESLQWYADTIGFDLNKALAVINAIPPLYNQ